MNSEKYKKYICWGATALIVLLLLAAFVFFVLRWGMVREIVRTVADILSPVIYGAAMAYLLTPIYNRTRRYVSARLEKFLPDEKSRGKLAGFAATTVSLLLLLAVVVGLMSMLIPQLIQSIRGIVEALPSSFYNLQVWLEHLFVNNPDMEQNVMQYYNEGVVWLQDWVKNEVVPNLYRILNSVSTSVISMVNELVNALIGIIVMAYLLNMKDKLVVQAKMIIYSVLPIKAANKVIEEFRYVHFVFGGFIIGKLLDSLIIGIMSFVLLSAAKMPYVLLISVIIGVTNVIPFFGPFIGAIPSAFLILLVNPMQCLYFVGFILLLQQFDGNILGPKILGDSTGLSSFWVLFSILLFGGLFGFVGMIIGVPTFAVFYRLVRELVTYLLGKKELSADIEEYRRLNYIDEEHKTYIKK
ncbi:MAG: AI-2E family transporter [Lachnospiraceae bacterium]|nr:AI-2E family transporter [Lachnospiraceae bacterium]